MLASDPSKSVKVSLIVNAYAPPLQVFLNGMCLSFRILQSNLKVVLILFRRIVLSDLMHFSNIVFNLFSKKDVVKFKKPLDEADILT